MEETWWPEGIPSRPGVPWTVHHPEVPIYKVRCTVLKTHPGCGAKHQVGDTFEIMGPRKEDSQGWMCPSAFAFLHTYIFALRYGARFPFTEEPGTLVRVCPDCDTPVVFELKRLEDEKLYLSDFYQEK